MQFFLNKEHIEFDIFSTIFPVEAELLSHQLDLEVDIFVNENKKTFSLKYKNFKPIKINIDNILERHKVFFFKNSYHKDLLAKAIGLKKGKKKPRVLDATAGMMGDGLLMYSYGLEELICFERNPVVAALGVNAVRNSSANIQYNFGNYSKSPDRGHFDVIFYDPMYHEKNSKTAPKKEMEIFRNLIGPDMDILETALNLKKMAKERLVIKRSNKAVAILENPSHTIKGKSTSYDVYL